MQTARFHIFFRLDKQLQTVPEAMCLDAVHCDAPFHPNQVLLDHHTHWSHACTLHEQCNCDACVSENVH